LPWLAADLARASHASRSGGRAVAIVADETAMRALGETVPLFAPEQFGRGRWRAHPLDRSGRQMVDEVHDARQVEPFELLGDLRPDAFKGFHFREQRIENFGPHTRCCHCERSEAIQLDRRGLFEASQ